MDAKVGSEAKELIAEIEAELASEKSKRTSLNTTVIRPKRADFAPWLSAQRDAFVDDAKALRPELDAHVAAIDEGFRRLEESVINTVRAQSRVRRYSDKAREATVPALEKYVEIRNMIGGRLGDTPLARGVKEEIGVGSNVDGESPLVVFDAGTRQLEALRRKDAQPLFKARRLRVALHATALEKLLIRLRAEIDAGVGGVKSGEAADDSNAAALFLEIALDRAGVLLQDAGLTAQAAAWRERIPRRHYRRAGDPTPKDPVEPSTPVVTPVDSKPDARPVVPSQD